MSNEMGEWLEKYFNRFNKTFPTIPLLRDNGETYCIYMIKTCLDMGKDVYEAGLHKLPPNHGMY